MFAGETYAAGRRFVFVEGKSRREAARVFGLSRETVAKMCRSFGLARLLGRTSATALKRAIVCNISGYPPDDENFGT